MARLSIDVGTNRDKKVIEDLAEERGTTVDELFAPWVRDLIQNAAGISPGLSGAVQDAIANDLSARAISRKAERLAAAKAQALEVL